MTAHTASATLPDYLQSGLRVVFVGFNPGTRSAAVGHYYAGRNNRFYWLLHQAGLTDRRLRPDEDHLLLRYGFGLTDIVKRASPSSADLTWAELRQGREGLLAKLAHFRPQVACYTGKGVYRALLGRAGLPVTYGRQPTQAVPGVIDFVVPSPSGRSREPLAVKLAAFRDLRALLERLG